VTESISPAKRPVKKEIKETAEKKKEEKKKEEKPKAEKPRKTLDIEAIVGKKH
jgi:hypothetical protein